MTCTCTYIESMPLTMQTYCDVELKALDSFFYDEYRAKNKVHVNAQHPVNI